MAEILEEARGLIANGFVEIVLTGINIGDFDGGVPKGSPKISLAALVREIDALPGLKRLRISSIDPDEVDEELLQAVIQGKTTAPCFHLVLQAGSAAILKRMNRKYTLQQFMGSVEMLRAARPDFSFTTDVIVGFPGETEEDFQATLEMIEKVRFAKVHMFPYSSRAGTKAALFTDHIPKEVITERKGRLLRLAERVAYDLRTEFVGKQMKVLIERVEGEWAYGHSEHFFEVKLPAEGCEKNRVIDVLVVGNDASSLIGEPACAFVPC